MKNYFLRCSDGSFYVGVTNNIDRRLYEHNNPRYKSYTSKRRPVRLLKYFLFNQISEALNFEKQVKRWTRKKKIALVNEDWNSLIGLSKNHQDK